MSATVSYAKDETVEEIGDYLQVVLPAAAWASTFIAGSPDGGLWDKEGTKQATLSIGSALATMTAAKYIVAKTRPSGKDRSSYPSGHTTGAFTGAVFLDRRYGWKWGLLGYAGGLFTAYSRVQADAHFADDVTAGASTAIMYGFRFVTPQPRGLAIMPTASDNGIGVNISITGTPPALGGATRRGPEDFQRFLYLFAFGPAYLKTNKIKAPADGGTTFDLADFDKVDNPTTTSTVNFEVRINESHSLLFGWDPFESRDFGRFSEPVDFGGVVFPADSTLRSAYRLYDVRARYTYSFITDGPWLANAGLGLMYQEVAMKLQTEDESLKARADDSVLLPYIHATLGYAFSERFEGVFDMEGLSLSSDWMLDTVFMLNYNMGYQWTAHAGYRYYGRRIETDDLRNEVAYNIPYLAISYSW
jgi:hypothetical protein